MSDLLDYVLNLDEPGDRARVEARLRGDPVVASHVAALRRLVEPLEADREAPEPTPGLVVRTIGRVAEHIRLHGEAPTVAAPMADDHLARLAPDEWIDVIAHLDRRQSTATSRWRRADLAVAAAIACVALGLVIAAIPYLRHRQNVVACKNQLRELYAAIDAYAGTHRNDLPAVSDEPPHNTAGSFAAILRDAGTLPSSVGVGCPAAGPQDFATYAYTLGYRDETGQLRGLNRDTAPDALPLVGDRPAIGRTTPNPDHRRGQNVLFVGGHVSFCSSGHVGVGGDDIYRNQAMQVRAGVMLWDTVLGVAGDQP